MTAEQAAQALADLVRRLAYSPHSGLLYSTRSELRHALKAFDSARKRKTGFERIMADDEDELPGAKVATSTLPLCKFCERQYRPRKGQKYCSTECRKKAYHLRQARIRHRDKSAAPVLASNPCHDLFDNER